MRPLGKVANDKYDNAHADQRKADIWIKFPHPVLSDEQMKETVAKFKKLLTDKGAEIVNEEAWGLKKMAYAIQKKSTGFYCLLEFKAEPEVIKSLETGYRRDEKVIRHMVVKLDKYAVQYAEKRKHKWTKKLEEA